MKFILALSLFSGALALPEPHATASHKVSLSKGRSLTYSDGRANIHEIFASLDATLAKFQHIKPFPHDERVALDQAKQAARRRKEKVKSLVNVPLTDQYSLLTTDLTCYGPVTIGSGDGNAQTFQLIFDTGSSDIWVPGPGCSWLDGCPHSTKYDEGGIDLEGTVRMNYMSGTASGGKYVDDVTIAGLKSVNQTFLSVTSTADLDTGADGVIGMGFSAIAQDKGTTFFENLVASGAVEKDEFSFYLGRATSCTADDSELAIGGRDSTKHTGSFITVPVTSRGYWLVALDNMKVNGHIAGPNTEGQAAIDTGSSTITAPHIAAKQIMSQIPGSLAIPVRDSGSTTYLFIFPCDTADSYIPSITFAGESFQINPLDFNTGKLAAKDINYLSGGNNSLAAEIRAKTDMADYCIAGLKGNDKMTIANDGAPAVLFAPSIGNDSS
ncbi:aspartyl protease [Diaporthe sp. PMI_573]|nr:aspartyl protease [Diaporthaceae sp. PMI_573]